MFLDNLSVPSSRGKESNLLDCLTLEHGTNRSSWNSTELPFYSSYNPRRAQISMYPFCITDSKSMQVCGFAICITFKREREFTCCHFSDCWKSIFAQLHYWRCTNDLHCLFTRLEIQCALILSIIKGFFYRTLLTDCLYRLASCSGKWI